MNLGGIYIKRWILSKILSKSNQFRYYKDKYHELNKEINLIKTENDNIYTKLSNYSKIISDFEDIQLKNFQKKEKNSINKSKRILFVLHSGSGGTPKNVKDIIKGNYNNYDCYVLISNKKEMILYYFNKFEYIIIDRWQLSDIWLVENMYIEEYYHIYFNILYKFSFDIVHIHHLIYHSFDLLDLCKKFNIPTVLSIHDFYYICPAYTLLDGNYDYCRGDCDNSHCIENCFLPMSDMTRILDIKSFLNKWRYSISEKFEHISFFVIPSYFIKDIFQSCYSIDSDKFIIIEHGIESEVLNENLFELPSIHNPIKLLFIGNINIQKGALFIKDLYNLNKEYIFEFHFLGNISKELKNIGIYHGNYKVNELKKYIKKIKPSFICIFSICPETYCYTLSESWIFGIPVFVSKIGALQDRLLNNGGGWFIDINDVNKTYDIIKSIVENKEEYLFQQNKISHISFNSLENMSNEYNRLYQRLLNR